MRQVIQDHHREVVVLHTPHQVRVPFLKMILQKKKGKEEVRLGKTVEEGVIYD